MLVLYHAKIQHLFSNNKVFTHIKNTDCALINKVTEKNRSHLDSSPTHCSATNENIFQRASQNPFIRGEKTAADNFASKISNRKPL